MNTSTGQILHEVLQALGASSEEERKVASDIAKINQRLANHILFQKLPQAQQLELLELVMKGNQNTAFQKMKGLFDEAAIKEAQRQASEKTLRDYFEHMFTGMDKAQKQTVSKILEKYRELTQP